MSVYIGDIGGPMERQDKPGSEEGGIRPEAWAELPAVQPQVHEVVPEKHTPLPPCMIPTKTVPNIKRPSIH